MRTRHGLVQRRRPAWAACGRWASAVATRWWATPVWAGGRLGGAVWRLTSPARLASARSTWSTIDGPAHACLDGTRAAPPARRLVFVTRGNKCNQPPTCCADSPLSPAISRISGRGRTPATPTPSPELPTLSRLGNGRSTSFDRPSRALSLHSERGSCQRRLFALEPRHRPTASLCWRGLRHRRLPTRTATLLGRCLVEDGL